jgi:hypothetical protein
MRLLGHSPAGQEPRRVEDEQELRGHVDKGGKQWTEHANRCQCHPNRVDDQGAREVLPDDAPRSSRQDERFN